VRCRDFVGDIVEAATPDLGHEHGSSS